MSFQREIRSFIVLFDDPLVKECGDAFAPERNQGSAATRPCKSQLLPRIALPLSAERLEPLAPGEILGPL